MTIAVKQAMILAAGRGERMMPLTATCPKPLLTVHGKPLIEYPIQRLVDAGVERIVINHAYLGHMIEAALGDGSRFGAEIVYSPESSALETAGGIVNALPLLNDEAFWVVNGDVFCPFDFTIETTQTSVGLAHLMMVANPEHNPNGDFSLDGYYLNDDSEAERLTYSGIGLYQPSLFRGLSAGSRKLAPLLREAMAEHLVTGFQYKGEWCDVGTPERLAQIESR